MGQDMTEYSNTIDAATWRFIRATEAAYPADTAGFTIAQRRAAYDAICAVLDAGRPPGLAVTDQTVAGMPCRIYHAGPAQLIHYHGGGFYVGGLHSHDSICAELAQRTGLTVTAVQYRLAPEHPHRAAHDDAMAVVLATRRPLLLAGDSAGGNLASALSHGLRGDTRRGSYLTHAHPPMQTRADVVMGAAIRRSAADHPTALPLRETDFSGPPPTIAIAAACAPPADDSADYAAAISTARGRRAMSLTKPGVVHGYLRARHSVPRAAAAFTRICDALTDLAQGIWPPRSMT